MHISVKAVLDTLFVCYVASQIDEVKSGKQYQIRRNSKFDPSKWATKIQHVSLDDMLQIANFLLLSDLTKYVIVDDCDRMFQRFKGNYGAVCLEANISKNTYLRLRKLNTEYPPIIRIGNSLYRYFNCVHGTK